MDAPEPFFKLYHRQFHKLRFRLTWSRSKHLYSDGLQFSVSAPLCVQKVISDSSADNVQKVMVPLLFFGFSTSQSTFCLSNPFSDFLGCFQIFDCRITGKHFDILFACLVTSSCHPKSNPAEASYSILNSLRGFLSRRGKPQLFLSDKGTSLTGDPCKLQEQLSIHIQLIFPQVEIYWELNAPFAPHFGGVCR